MDLHHLDEPFRTAPAKAALPAWHTVPMAQLGFKMLKLSYYTGNLWFLDLLRVPERMR